MTHPFRTLLLSLLILATVTTVVCTAPAPPPPDVVVADADRDDFIYAQEFQSLDGKSVGILTGTEDIRTFSRDGRPSLWMQVVAPEDVNSEDCTVSVDEKGGRRFFPKVTTARDRHMVRWGVPPSCCLVELEVNGGVGAPPGEIFVATHIKVLDGSKAYPLKVAACVADVKTTYRKYRESLKGRLELPMADAVEIGRKHNAVKRAKPYWCEDEIYVSWMPKTERLRIVCQSRVIATTMERQSYAGVELGRAYELDKNGLLVRTTTLPARACAWSATETASISQVPCE